jgi:ABC-type transport system involved in multi-copper enzyme maturation permease subunit
MLAFTRRMLRDKYKSFIVYSIAAIVFLETYIALFPAMQKQAAQLDKLIGAMPPDMFKAFNMDPSALYFHSLEPFLSTDYLSFLWPILAIVFAVSMANYLLVNEVEKGTIDTLASLPVTRNRIFIERYLTGLLLLAVFTLVGIFGAIPLAQLNNVHFVLANYVTTACGALLFGWAVYSLATLFSVIFSDKGRATMATGAILIVMYVGNAVALINDKIKDLKYFSFFHYFSGSDLLAHNTYPGYILPVLGGFAVIVSVAALVWVNRRDLSV